MARFRVADYNKKLCRRSPVTASTATLQQNLPFRLQSVQSPAVLVITHQPPASLSPRRSPFPIELWTEIRNINMAICRHDYHNKGVLRSIRPAGRPTGREHMQPRMTVIEIAA
jgi:hypothetical protein